MSDLECEEQGKHAIEVLESNKVNLDAEEFRLSRSLIANGEWEIGLSCALSACLQKQKFNSVEGVVSLIGAVRENEKNSGELDRLLLNELQKARSGVTT